MERSPYWVAGSRHHGPLGEGTVYLEADTWILVTIGGLSGVPAKPLI